MVEVIDEPAAAPIRTFDVAVDVRLAPVSELPIDIFVADALDAVCPIKIPLNVAVPLLAILASTVPLLFCHSCRLADCEAAPLSVNGIVEDVAAVMVDPPFVDIVNEDKSVGA
mgnify:CR=1 FL=1